MVRFLPRGSRGLLNTQVKPGNPIATRSGLDREVPIVTQMRYVPESSCLHSGKKRVASSTPSSSIESCAKVEQSRKTTSEKKSKKSPKEPWWMEWWASLLTST
jgi:hypothetical protein